MKILPILFVLLLQAIHFNDKANNELKSSLVDLYGVASTRPSALEVGLTGMEYLLVSFLFVLAMIHRKRRLLNENIRKRVDVLREVGNKDTETVYGLGRALEDYRSKNCCLEFPLRKLARECDKLIKQVKQKLIETEIFYDSFSQLVPNAVMADINDLRIKVELVSLKEFIASEISAIKMVQDYCKDLIDDGVDEVERVIVAEGL